MFAAFHRVEELLEASGVKFGAATLEQLDLLWEEAKREEKGRLTPGGSAA